MGFDWTWLLIGLPLAFALGWAASRLDLRQLRIENQREPKAYFRGLNHLLNEQQDQAIDAFIEAVQTDPDASELHFALGNMFRRRGDYDRAVRVHEHLLARGDVSADDRLRAQHALAQDYWKAGLLDRAQSAYEALLGTRFELDARVALLAVFERGRDWRAALGVAEQIRGNQTGADVEPATRHVLTSLDARMVHYLCEQAQGQSSTAALALLDRANALQPQVARAWVERSRLELARGRPLEALDALEQLARHAPAAIGLVASDMVTLCQGQLVSNPDKLPQILQLLRDADARTPSLDIMQALALAAPSAQAARNEYMRHLERKPSLVAATQWLAQERLEHEQFHPQVQRALDHAVKPLQRYRCRACGFATQAHFWQCPGCQAWDSLPTTRVEEM